MKQTLTILILFIVCSACASFHSLDDLNCKLSVNHRMNFVGKWKVNSQNKKFVWWFYSDNRTATRENEYLTGIRNNAQLQVYINTWQNDKRDTLKLFMVTDGPDSKRKSSMYSLKTLHFYIISNECRKIVLVNLANNDTLTLKRKQYFYQ